MLKNIISTAIVIGFCVAATAAETNQIQKPNRAGSLTNRLGTRQVGEFIGTLVAVDKQKQTVSIGSGTPDKTNSAKPAVYLVTTNTVFFKHDAPATLNDAVVGQELRYGVRIPRDGTPPQVTLLRFLPPAQEKKEK